MKATLFLIVLVALPAMCVSYTPTNAAALRNEIFANYSSKDRPTNTIDIYLSFGLFHITNFDIVLQRLHCIGFLVANWNDERLQWNATDHGDMHEFFVPLSDVWSPPLVLSNSASEITMFNDNDDLASTNVFLSTDGNVTWMIPVSIESQCSVLIKYYPFDSQHCTIVVSSWLFLKSQINLKIWLSSIFYDLYEENGEWDISDSDSEEKTRLLMGYELSAVHFNLHLKRKYSYYLLNMLLPAIILALMGPFVFMLPVESGEKNGFSLTILLSFSVVLSVVSDNIPATSTHVCLLSVGLLISFILCSIETLLTVVSCTFHEYANKGQKMGKKWQKIAMFLARVTLYRKVDDKGQGEKQDAESKGNTVDKMNCTKRLSKAELKDIAWDTKSETESEVEIEYSYGDLVAILDKFNLYAFSIVTILSTLILFIVIAAGGAAS